VSNEQSKRSRTYSLLLSSLFSLLFSLFFVSCSFDYGNQAGGDDMPDIVMDNVEYVRVRSADPQARLQAERVERFEERRIMELRNFSFEQFGSRGADVNAYGRAGSASFEIDTGNIRMGSGVRIDVESEDIIIETDWIEWRDRPKTLSGRETDEVYIFQESGTVFSGRGFRADARQRTWEFSGGVSGTYIQEDEEEVAAEETPALEFAGEEMLAEITEAGYVTNGEMAE
jgi:LPS export ABC transporter protein LptC